MQTVMYGVQRDCVCVWNRERETVCGGKTEIVKGKEKERLCVWKQTEREIVYACMENGRRFCMYEKWRLCVRGKERDCVSVFCVFLIHFAQVYTMCIFMIFLSI